MSLIFAAQGCGGGGSNNSAVSPNTPPNPQTPGADPLGTASGIPESCPTGGLPGNCWEVTVSCPGVPSVGPGLKVTAPSGTPIGTVIFGVGGTGTGWYDQAFTNGASIIQSVVNAGFTAVQINFRGSPAGWLTGPGGVRKTACNYATAAVWIYNNIHQGSSSAPMCATGNSGGSGAIAYALAHYGLGNIFAMVEPTSGPPFGRLDWGCLCTQGPITMPSNACGNTISTCYGISDATSFIDPAYGNTACSTKDTSFATTFLNDSIMSPDVMLSYPKTDVHVLYGGKDGSPAVSLGFQWASAIQSKSSISCVADAVHEIPNATDGAAQITSDLINFCKLQP